MLTIASYSIKGGVGKTATSVNLAYAFAQRGQKTLLIDLDAQGASSFYFKVGASKKLSAKRFLTDTRRLIDNIRESDFENLDIIPSNLAYRHFDAVLDGLDKKKRRLSRTLAPLESEYSTIIIDCPPNITLLSENVFRAADWILVPVIPTTLSRRTYDQLKTFFDEKGYPKRKIRPYFSMMQGVSRLHRDIAREMQEADKRFLKTTVPLSADIERMGMHRAPVQVYAPQTSGGRAYEALVTEVVKLTAKRSGGDQ